MLSIVSIYIYIFFFLLNFEIWAMSSNNNELSEPMNLEQTYVFA